MKIPKDIQYACNTYYAFSKFQEPKNWKDQCLVIINESCKRYNFGFSVCAGTFWFTNKYNKTIEVQRPFLI